MGANSGYRTYLNERRIARRRKQGHPRNRPLYLAVVARSDVAPERFHAAMDRLHARYAIDMLYFQRGTNLVTLGRVWAKKVDLAWTACPAAIMLGNYGASSWVSFDAPAPVIAAAQAFGAKVWRVPSEFREYTDDYENGSA